MVISPSTGWAGWPVRVLLFNVFVTTFVVAWSAFVLLLESVITGAADM
ncbi:MAG: hypothetical protein M3Y77_04275 [Actinomycetota bacterium]|nr:hypothetical protein [Actinomycetota bacterium]